MWGFFGRLDMLFPAWSNIVSILYDEIARVFFCFREVEIQVKNRTNKVIFDILQMHLTFRLC